MWETISTLSTDIAFLTETWLNPSSNPDITTATTEGYKMIHRDCTNKQGGGIAIIFKDTIRCTITNNDPTPLMEHLNVLLQTDPQTTIRGTLTYRPLGPQATFCNNILNIIAP